MARINIDVFARLHEATLRRTERESQQRFERMGQEAGRALAGGFENAAPRVRRALNSAADAALNYTRRTRDLAKATQERSDAVAKALKLEGNIGRAYSRNADIASELANTENELKGARRDVSFATVGATARENNLREKRAAHHETAEKLRKKELDLKQIRLDKGAKAAIAFEKTFMDLRRQNAAEIAYITKKEDELKNKKVELQALKEREAKLSEDYSALLREEATSVKDLDDAEKDLLKTREDILKTDADLLRLNEEVIRSNRRREESLRSVADAEALEQEKRHRASQNKSHPLRNISSMAGNILTSIPFVPGGPAGPAVAIGLGAALVELVSIAAAAAQSLWLLPAAATAGGAAFGTLALATAGFGDALKDMGDPEKFAEALQGLSPNAQQAALSIKALVDGPLGDLKNATQDTFFAGIGEQLHNFTNRMLPTVQQGTTGIAGAFNEMFMGVTNQLMQPDTSLAVNNLVNNIVAAFRELAPAMGPMTQAFTDIASVGASFLPDMARGAADMARAFADFIAEARASGDLQKWLGDGLTTMKQLGEGAWALARALMALAPLGQKILPHIVELLKDIEQIMPAIAGASALVGPSIGTWVFAVENVARSFNMLKGIYQGVEAVILAGMDRIRDKLDKALEPIRKAVEIYNAIAGSPVAPLLPDIEIPHFGTNQDRAGSRVTKGPSLGGNATGGLAPTRGGTSVPKGGTPPSTWFPGVPDPRANFPAYPGPFDVPQPTPKDADGSKITDSERREAIRNSLNPNDFMPALGSQPMMPAMPNSGQTSGYERLQPGAKSLEAALRTQFPELGAIGGWRADGQGSTDHPSGSALDIMIPNWESEAGKALGDRINQFLLSNAGALGVDSTIWRDQMMYASGQSGGTVGGHQNHIHARTTESPNANGQPPLMWGNGGQPYAQNGLGYYNVDHDKVLELQQRVQRESWDVRDAAMEVEVLKRDNLATQQERDKAEQKLIEERWQLQAAERDLYDAQQGDWKKVGSGSGSGDSQLGPGIDSDFGFSKGLGGIAENLIKMVATMAFSPLLMSLGMQTNGPSDGYGLMGMLGAQGAFNFGGMGAPAYPYGPGGMPNGAQMPMFSGFGDPNSPQAIANMIYQQAISRGYSPHEAQSIVAYAIGESSLNPNSAPGAQGGSGFENEVVGLFQQKPAFAQGGGIDPSQRTDPVANTYAYLNQLEANRNLPIEQALPKTSVGGPLASGKGAQPQNWGNLMSQAAEYLGLPQNGFAGDPFAPAAPPSSGGGSSWLGAGVPGLPPLPQGGGGGGSVLPGTGFPNAPVGLGGSGPSPTFGTNAGAAAGQNPFAPTQPVGQVPGSSGWQPQGGGGPGLGGMPMAALKGATSGIDMLAPGAGQAAQTGIQMANRSIQYLGQLGANAVMGLFETFGLSDSVLGDPSKSWMGRVMAGFAGAKPAVPTSAGQTQAPAQQQQQSGQQHVGTGQPPGPTGPTVHIENFTQAENRNGQQAAQDLAFQAYGSWGAK